MTYISNLKHPKQDVCEIRRICEKIETMPPRDREIMKGIVEMLLITARGNDFMITEVTPKTARRKESMP
jgi:FixJ family two-component response regulator